MMSQYGTKSGRALLNSISSSATILSKYCLSHLNHANYGFGSIESQLSFIIEQMLSSRQKKCFDLKISDRHYFGSDLQSAGDCDNKKALREIIKEFIKLSPTSGQESSAERLQSLADHKYLKFLIAEDLECILEYSGQASHNNQQTPSLISSKIHDLLDIKSRIPQLHQPISVTIFGFPKSVLGIGEDARRLCDVLFCIGCRVEIVDFSYDYFPESDEWSFYKGFQTDTPTSSIYIFCMPLIEAAKVMAENTFPTQGSNFIIAYAPWELNEVPDQLIAFADVFDEIWCSTTFQKETYEKKISVLARVVPFYVQTCRPESSNLIKTIIDESCFNCGCAFDFNSTVSRKNPEGAILAFQCAFPRKYQDVRLIIKTLHAERYQSELDRIIALCEGDDRIIFVDGALEGSEMAHFLSELDIFISLHRSEGFGRILAEAMLLGTVVLCTSWSGPVDFVDPSNAYLVDFKLTPVLTHEYPLAIGEWAEPNTNTASIKLLESYINRSSLQSMATRAQQKIQSTYSIEAVSDLFVRLLNHVNANISNSQI